MILLQICELKKCQTSGSAAGAGGVAGLTKTNTNLDISNFFQGKSIVKNLLHPRNLTCPLKNDGWKMSFLLGLPLFRGYVKFPGCTPCHLVCVLFRTCFTQVTSALTFFHTAWHLSSSCKRNGLA